MNNKMTRFASIVCAVCILVMEARAGGTIQNVQFYSASLNTNRWVQIYLPEGYNPTDATVRYPVIYFLHGATYNHTGYSDLFPILDSLISKKAIRPVIVVKPDGSVGPWGGSFYTNSALYGKFEDFIVYDLVTYIDSAYRTLRDSTNRSIMGHSMGAYGAMKAGLKHPGLYRGVASHSGALDLHHHVDRVSAILTENGGHAPYTYLPTAGAYTYLTFTAAGAFSPNPSNTPYKVDFLLDVTGNIVDTTFEKWLVHNPARLAASVPPRASPALYFDCGIQDELMNFPFNVSFKDSLDLLGLAYTWLPFQGGHINQLFTRIPISLRFLDSVMKASATTVGEDLPMLPHTMVLHQNYPNPFNPSTTIGYGLPNHSQVTLTVFNTLGQQVATLLNGEQEAGYHEVKFDAKDLSSAVYFYRMQAGTFVETRKLLLVR